MANPAMAIRGLFLCSEVKAMPIITLQNRIRKHTGFVGCFLIFNAVLDLLIEKY
jgi:hypothetical protein